MIEWDLTYQGKSRGDTSRMCTFLFSCYHSASPYVQIFGMCSWHSIILIHFRLTTVLSPEYTETFLDFFSIHYLWSQSVHLFFVSSSLPGPSLLLQVTFLHMCIIPFSYSNTPWCSLFSYIRGLFLLFVLLGIYTMPDVSIKRLIGWSIHAVFLSDDRTVLLSSQI